MSTGHKWKPLQRAAALPPSAELVGLWMDHHRVDEAGARRLMAQDLARSELWRNDLYQVEVRRYPEVQQIHLNIRRRDGFVGRDWRHFQQIKNELAGPECEAVELYPAESRLVDPSNKYHLWCSTDPTFRFPMGFEKRDVQFGESKEGGMRQRPPMQVRGSS